LVEGAVAVSKSGGGRGGERERESLDGKR